MRRHPATLALALLLALAAGAARAGGTPIGAIPLTTNVYSAAEVDALIAESGGGGDAELVTNLVSEAQATILNNAPDAAAWTALKLIVADLWRRVDALDADGSDALSAAAAEQLIADRVEQFKASINLDLVASLALPKQTMETRSTTITANTSGVAAELSPVYATRYYASTANNRSLAFASFSGVGNNPCLLVLQNFSSVTFPSGAKVETGYSYNSGNPSLYAVYKVYDVLYLKRLYP